MTGRHFHLLGAQFKGGAVTAPGCLRAERE